MSLNPGGHFIASICGAMANCENFSVILESRSILSSFDYLVKNEILSSDLRNSKLRLRKFFLTSFVKLRRIDVQDTFKGRAATQVDQFNAHIYLCSSMFDQRWLPVRIVRSRVFSLVRSYMVCPLATLPNVLLITAVEVRISVRESLQIRSGLGRLAR